MSPKVRITVWGENLHARENAIVRNGHGKIFYFAPGHEVYPIYHHPVVRQVLRNAVGSAAPNAAKWIDR